MAVNNKLSRLGTKKFGYFSDHNLALFINHQPPGVGTNDSPRQRAGGSVIATAMSAPAGIHTHLCL